MPFVQQPIRVHLTQILGLQTSTIGMKLHSWNSKLPFLWFKLYATSYANAIKA
jgi:hypothetical protein